MTLSFKSLSVPSFFFLQLSFLKFFLKEVQNVLFVGASVSLDYSGEDCFSSNVKHFFDVF